FGHWIRCFRVIRTVSRSCVFPLIGNPDLVDDGVVYLPVDYVFVFSVIFHFYIFRVYWVFIAAVCHIVRRFIGVGGVFFLVD
ncbi:hypothetical protein AAHH78_35610, partial [Burkholderia pseudomallei]